MLLRCVTHSLFLKQYPFKDCHGLVVKGLSSKPKGSVFKTYTGLGSF